MAGHRNLIRRVLAELEDKPGLGDAELSKMKRKAEMVMRDVDAAPPHWRALVNDYHEERVAPLAHAGLSAAQARAILEQHYGKPI